MEKEIIDFLMKYEQLHVVTHNDTDGITAGANMAKVLSRMKKKHSISTMPYQNNDGLEKMFQKTMEKKKALLFVDMGTGYGEALQKFPHPPVGVIDHHNGVKPPADAFWNPAVEEGRDSIKYATASTLVAKLAFDLGVADKFTTYFGIVGSTGDLADLSGSFQKDSLIQEIIDIGIEKGWIEEYTGARIPTAFGLSTAEAIDFMFLPPAVRTIDEIRDELFKRYDNPNPGIDVLDKSFIEWAFGKNYKMVWGQKIIAPWLPECLAENHYAMIAVANGSQKSTLDTLQGLLKRNYTEICKNAKENIKQKYQEVKKTVQEIIERGLYMVAPKAIIVTKPIDSSIGASLLANYMVNKNLFNEPEKPLILYSKNNGFYSASIRVHYDYQNKYDLGAMMAEAVKGIPGANGGGHKVAAGATVPPEGINKFLTYFFT